MTVCVLFRMGRDAAGSIFLVTDSKRKGKYDTMEGKENDAWIRYTTKRRRGA